MQKVTSADGTQDRNAALGDHNMHGLPLQAQEWGQNHNVTPSAIVPVLAEYVAGSPTLAI